jgi:hypothetical protein
MAIIIMIKQALTTPSLQAMHPLPPCLHNFGKIKEGTIAKHAFKFTNTGNHPLLISDVQVGCGCTVPSYSKEPVLSGQTGEVSIEFNSSNRPGANHKNVKILSNIEGGQTEVTFDAEVVK